jgi:hypothetical protein
VYFLKCQSTNAQNHTASRVGMGRSSSIFCSAKVKHLGPLGIETHRRIGNHGHATAFEHFVWNGLAKHLPDGGGEQGVLLL